MLVLTTTNNVEIRIPLDEIAEVREVEPTGDTRPMAPHPYLHREGVQRCAACWRSPLDPAHTEPR
jgi:hypothetical protein